MSCYVSFFLGDFTQEDQDNFNWDKVPCLLSVSTRNDIGQHINKFDYNKATLVTREVVEKIRVDLDAMIREKKDSIREYKEIKDSILKNLPNKIDEYEDATYHLSELKAEIEEIEEEITFIVKQQGKLDTIEDLLYGKFSITAVVG